MLGPAAMAALCVCTILGEDWRDAMEKVGERPLLFLAASLGGVVVNLATNMMVAAGRPAPRCASRRCCGTSVVFVSTAVLVRFDADTTALIGFPRPRDRSSVVSPTRGGTRHPFTRVRKDSPRSAGDGTLRTCLFHGHATHFPAAAAPPPRLGGLGTPPSGSRRRLPA